MYSGDLENLALLLLLKVLSIESLLGTEPGFTSPELIEGFWGIYFYLVTAHTR